MKETPTPNASATNLHDLRGIFDTPSQTKDVEMCPLVEKELKKLRNLILSVP